MSWDTVWPLPRTNYTKVEVEQAVTKALSELRLQRLPDAPYPDWEDGEENAFAFWVSLPRRLLLACGDQPGHDDEYECVFTVAQNIVGEDEAERWEVRVHSNDLRNREANDAIGHVAARVSVLLDGPDEPEL